MTMCFKRREVSLRFSVASGGVPALVLGTDSRKCALAASGLPCPRARGMSAPSFVVDVVPTYIGRSLSGL